MPPRLCKATRRDTTSGEDMPCGMTITGERCMKFREHVTTHPTGFCNGKKQCEGTRPKSPSGKSLPVCTFWLTCPCECHADLTEMFAMAERERRVVDNPEYVPQRSIYWMPSSQDLAEMRIARMKERNKNTEVEVVKSEDPRVPDLVTRKFQPTESGRAARGQLEEYVQRACDAWIKTDRQTECTTKWVAAWIKEEYGTDASRGAIDAVWKRWVSIGFAMTLDKPTQFAAYTKDGRTYGLEGMKERAKRGQQKVLVDMKLGRR